MAKRETKSRTPWRKAIATNTGERCARCKVPEPIAANPSLAGWIHEAWMMGTEKVKRALCQRCAISEALEFFADVALGPPVPETPALVEIDDTGARSIDRDLWRSMLCRDGQKCSCEMCRWEERYGASVADWQRSQGLRPRSRSSLPTFDHVAVCWAERTDYRSAFGALLARARDEAQAPERSRVPWAARRAEVAIEFERSLIWASKPEPHRGGMNTISAVRLFASAIQGTQIEEPSQAKVVRILRTWTMRDLAARDVICPPRGARDQRAVADRVIEIRIESDRRRTA